MQSSGGDFNFDGLGRIRREVAEKYADDLRQAAQLARTEEDLRIASETLLGDALKQVGIATVPAYERSYADHGGRSDAVYGRVVIEYEPVGAFNRRSGVDHAAEQLERYLVGEAGSRVDAEALKRVVGVGIDGHQIFFLQFRDVDASAQPLSVDEADGVLQLTEGVARTVEPVVQGPYPVDGNSIQTFFLYLRAAHRSRLTPQGLADQFGPSALIAREVVGHLYGLLLANEREPLTQTLYREWDRIFGIVYGDDLERVSKHLSLLCAQYAVDADTARFKPLLFAVHTYYAILMKTLAAELVALQRESLIESFVQELAVAADVRVHAIMESLESGAVYAHYSVHNFLEADFFGWYLRVWDANTAEGIRGIARALGTFEPATGLLDPRPTQDLLKRLYQYLIPREIRHDLGEYYTPRWLVEHTMNLADYGGGGGRVLDPACGTGSFVVEAINRRNEYLRRHEPMMTEAERAGDILSNIVGFELNPLAVIAARTNYLLALGSLIRDAESIEIPVYLCDSVLAPTAVDMALLGENYMLATTVGTFEVPGRIVADRSLPTVTSELDIALVNGYSAAEFVQLIQRLLPHLDIFELGVLERLYTQIADLKSEGRDGVWARIIRNSFAPLLAGIFDLVVGNPPWVNWQSLAPSYRAATLKLWVDSGMFTLDGSSARLGGGKKDLAALFTYRAADAFLRSGGRLAFVVTQSLLKGRQASEGFRRFQIGEGGAKLGVIQVHDLEALQPFQGASTKTVVLSIVKNQETTYPVPYTVWRKRVPRARVNMDWDLPQILEHYVLEQQAASPVDPADRKSPWLTTSMAIADAIAPAIGKSDYGAFIGVSTWANGIYWLDVQEKAGSLIRVENLAAEAKDPSTAPPRIPAKIETASVYPLVRSRDIRRWLAEPSIHILVPQDKDKRRGIDETTMRIQQPRTYAFLKKFEQRLADRSGMKKYFKLDKGDPFYSVYNFSELSLSEYRVVWRQMTKRISAAVLTAVEDPYLGEVIPQTQHVVSVVAVESEQEAHYLCAMMNSSTTSVISSSYGTGKSYGLPSLLRNVAIPRFDTGNPQHCALAALAQRAAEATKLGSPVDDIELEIDQLAAQVLGITSDGIAAIIDFAATFEDAVVGSEADE